MSDTFHYVNSPDLNTQAYAELHNPDKPRHGASVEINARSGIAIFHVDRHGNTTLPVIESFKDGIRVGCTFISSEALKRIHGMHQRFLTKEDSTVHQAGSK